MPKSVSPHIIRTVLGNYLAGDENGNLDLSDEECQATYSAINSYLVGPDGPNPFHSLDLWEGADNIHFPDLASIIVSHVGDMVCLENDLTTKYADKTVVILTSSLRHSPKYLILDGDMSDHDGDQIDLGRVHMESKKIQSLHARLYDNGILGCLQSSSFPFEYVRGGADVIHVSVVEYIK